MRPHRTKTRKGIRTGKRTENKERTKEAILKAALELFSKKGFHAATTKEIARKARIAEGTLFNYFRTKEDLALFFFERELERMMEWFRQDKRLQHTPLPEQLFAIVHHHLERLGPYEEFIGAVYLRALQPVSKLSPLSLDSLELKVRYLRFIRDILEKAEGAGEIPRLGDMGSYLFGLFQLAVITHWLHDTSGGKENTLALLDRGLKVATSILKKGGWEW